MTTLPVPGASAPTVFSFDAAHNVRVVLCAGDHWFVASDIAGALGYDQPRKAVARHCKHAKSLKDLDGTFHTVEANQALDAKTKLIREPDVYRLIVGSALPSSEAFESWLFEDVLPAIRKTGRYQATPAEPAPAPDYLTNNDMANLARCIDYIQRDKRMPQAWRFSFWKAIRRVTRTKSPDKLEVRHLPDVADEALRIHTAVAILDAAIRKVEKDVLRRVFRNGEDGEQVIAKIEARILAQAVTDAANMTKALDAWQRRDVQALQDRTTAYLSIAHYPEGLEPKEVAA